MNAFQPMHLIVLVLIALVMWGWVAALVSAIRVPNDADYRSGTKLIWVLVIVFTHWIGALVYWAVGRPRSK